MRLNNRLTPYPVLASFRDDYLDSSFGVDVEAVQQFGDVRLSLSFALNEPTLEDLIAKGDAEFAGHIECPSTSYRKCVRATDGLFMATLGRLDVRDYIEICTFVVARRSIKGLGSPRFHPDYGDMTFDVEEGAVLAIGDSKQIAIKSDDDLAQRSSIINVTQAGAGQEDAMSVDTDQSSCILVKLRPDLYRVYAEYGGGSESDLILSLVILPALQAVLARMVEADDDESEKEWFQSILEILKHNNISLDGIKHDSLNMSTLSIAQRILGQPLERSLKSLVKEA